MHVYALIGLLAASSVQTKDGSADMPCPPWFISYANSSTAATTEMCFHCFCSPSLAFRITCDQKEQTSYLKWGNCAFYDNVTGDTIVGACPYVFPERLFEGQLMKLPQNANELNSFMCSKLSREVGQTLCGRCANGTGPSVTSVGSECVECRAVNLLYYILLRYLPATVIFLVILVVQFDVTSAPMAHYILYCNLLINRVLINSGTYSIPNSCYYLIVRVFLTFNSIWSFEPLQFISPSLCFSTQIEDIDMLYFEMLATLYPFFLLLLAYVVIELHARGFKPVVCLWRLLNQSFFIRWRRSWNPRASLVQSFSTVFFISYARLILLVGVPLNHTNFINQYGQIMHSFTATYIDPTVRYGYRKHIYLLVSSAVILIFIILPPILILMAYPTRFFRRLQNRLPSRVNLAISTFVSTFQGCYKDGLNGGRDYRVLSGGILALFLFVQVVIYSIDIITKVDDRQPIIAGQVAILILIAFTVMMALLRPYKSEIANHTGVCLLALLATGEMFFLFLDVSISHVEWGVISGVVLLSVSLPHFVFYGYATYRLWTKFKFKTIVARLCYRSETRVLEEQPLIN